MNVAEKLKDWISRVALEGSDADLTDTTLLLELGILDSVTIVKLHKWIASEFGVDIPVQQLTPKNLSSIRTIAELVTRLQGAKHQS